MEQIRVKNEPLSEDEDFPMEEDAEEMEIKMEPLMMYEDDSDEDSSTQDEESSSTEYPPFQGKVKQEPELSKDIREDMKTATCCIRNCGQKETNEIRLFRFPTDEIILAQWLVNTQVKPRLVNPPDLYVCQLHFEPEVVHGTQLEFWSLPTLRLGHEDYLVMDCLKQSEQVMKYIRGQYCSVISCFRSKDDGLRLFEYPDDPETFIKWRRKCRHDPAQVNRYGFRLCASHFSTDSFDPETGDLFAGSQPNRQLYPCLVPGCVREDGTSVNYFNVPRKPEEAEAWSHNLRIPLSAINRNVQRVCSRHFEDACLTELKKLRMGALPTICLGHDGDVLPNPETIRVHTEGIPCCVNGCGRRRTAKNQLFSGFPNDIRLVRKWIHNIHLDISEKEVDGLLVCHEHFEDRCFKRTKTKMQHLRVGSMPTRKLGHSSYDLFGLFESDWNIFQGKSKTNAFKKRRYLCCHPRCGRYETMVYELPRMDELQKVWGKHMNIREIPADARKAPKLCDIHFVIMYEYSAKNFSEHAPDEFLDADYKTARNKTFVQKLSCSIKGCDTIEPRDGYSMHDMKKNKELQKMWVENGQIELNRRLELIRVCGKHFEPKCFRTRILYAWSVPTLNLPGEAIHQNITAEQWKMYNQADKLNERNEGIEVENSDPNSIDGESRPVLEEAPNQKSYPKPKKLNVYRCAVPGCRKTFKDASKTFRFHKLPTCDETAAKWLHNTKLKVTKDQWTSIRICSDHFEKHCFRGIILRPGAVPTICSGSKSVECMYQSERRKNKNKPSSRFPRAANCQSDDFNYYNKKK
ncbi:hypothetical protein KR084_010330 [Drosophila pseudotakahashii]|nr:hypothetical protein KR084_010330 [Drosophila pseudotakahashii]